MEKIPALGTDLIGNLDRLYLEKCPDPNWNDRKIWMYVGTRRIVHGLVAKFKTEESDEIHTTNVFRKE